jgi:lysophospholipase L1-like esterase
MNWVTIWGNAMSTVLPHPAYYAKDITLRYPIFIPFDGNKIRITLDNFCCSEDVYIAKVGISKSNKKCELLSDLKYLTFDGKYDVKIKAHDYVVSDEIDYEVTSDEFIVVSIYLSEFTNLTSGVDIVGPLSGGYFAYGNQMENKVLDINKSKKTSWVYFLSNVDIYTSNENHAIICYGDSITSQDWPDYMMLSLRENNIKNVAVVRKAVSGTRILREYDCITYQSYGLCGKKRFNHEVGSVAGAKKIIIQHGINDIIHPVGEDVNIFRPMSDLPTSNDLVLGMNYYLEEANKLGLDTFVGTLLPIYGWRTYASFREIIKNEFNDWILNNTNVIDFNDEIGNLIDGKYYFKDECDSGDHLHPSKYAYKLMGELAVKKIYIK